MQELVGRTAVVTGAASGIGRALAERFAAEGMAVVLADVQKGELEAAADALARTYGSIEAVVTDVSSPESVAALSAAAIKRFGAVHVVCNNAGVTAPGLTWEAPLEVWRWIMEVNFYGVLYGVKEFVPLLRTQNEGHIVNTASMGGLVTGPGVGPYSASKHAVVALTETLFKELLLEGSAVGASVLCPGAVHTAIIDSSRRLQPADWTVPADIASRASDLETESLRRTTGGAIEPAIVAGQVVEAIRAGKLWILTHPERYRSVTDRARQIVEGINPDPVYPT